MTLYTLNTHNVICQMHLNEAGKNPAIYEKNYMPKKTTRYSSKDDGLFVVVFQLLSSVRLFIPMDYSIQHTRLPCLSLSPGV